MEQNPNICWTPRKAAVVIFAFLIGAAAAIAIGALLVSIRQHKYEAVQYPLRILEIGDKELDPAVWGRNFPREYATFKNTSNSTLKTPYGGPCLTASSKRFQR